LNARWEPILHEKVGLGIGINTGVARVGNTGSHRKFKYSALGSPVNLASRVQGATKYLKMNLLITEMTRAKLDASFPCRRLGKIRVVNIKEGVSVYELAPPEQSDWSPLQQKYEEALEKFEQGQFHDAAQILGNLTTMYRNDGPSLLLLSRAVKAMVEECDPSQGVWELPGK
jgi:adenylate cyclase